MDIVDAHVHMIDVLGMVERMGDATLPAGISVLRRIEASIPKLLPETLLEQMDEAGIGKAILYAIDAPVLYASNEYVHGLCSQYPDRLIGFASTNPKDPNASDTLAAAVQEMGLRGVKLHPPLQDFFPNDEAVFGLYEKAIELDIPVVFHVGTTPLGPLARLAQASPLLIDDVAVRFPELRIMLTHLGTLWHHEAFMVVEKNPNVFIDTAAYLGEIRDVLTADMIARIGPDKIIFGTDYPMPYAGRQHRMKDFVDCVKGLPVSSEVLADIFSGNLERLLNGPTSPPAGVSATDILARIRELMSEGAGRSE